MPNTLIIADSGAKVTVALDGSTLPWLSNPSAYTEDPVSSNFGRFPAPWQASVLSFNISELIKPKIFSVRLWLKSTTSVTVNAGVFLNICPDYTNDASVNWTFDTADTDPAVSSTIVKIADNQAWIVNIWYSYDITSAFVVWLAASSYPTATRFNVFIYMPEVSTGEKYALYNTGASEANRPYLDIDWFRNSRVSVGVLNAGVGLSPSALPYGQGDY